MEKKLAILFITLLTGFLNCQSSQDDNTYFAEELLLAVNRLRVSGCQCGDTYMPAVKPLQWNDELAEAALRHARDMADNQWFEHTGTDGSNIAWRVSEAGYDWEAVGENIAHGYKSIPAVVEGWRKSPGHCRNLMKAAYVEMGVARVGNYWAQTLAKPRKERMLERTRE
ncbi:MAG: CAP domain-containing protein [Saprospiraceae bacterium]